MAKNWVHDFQLSICETFVAIHAARFAAEEAASAAAQEAACVEWNAALHAAKGGAGNMASGATWQAARDVAGTTARDVALMEARDVALTGAKNAAEKAASQIAKKSAKWQTVGIEAARASLLYIITNEEKIYSAVRAKLDGIKMPKTVDWKNAIDISIDVERLERMNLGGRCWYFSRVWNLITICRLAGTAAGAAVEECEKKFFATASKSGVGEFVSWMIGCTYSRSEFLTSVMAIHPQFILPPLWEIVYEFLSAPSDGLRKREILSLI